MKKIVFSLIIISLVLVIGCTEQQKGTICPQDAKACSDGTTLSRQGPNCEFPECPEENNGQGFGIGGSGDNEVICTADVMECPDGSFVSRQGPNCDFLDCSDNNLVSKIKEFTMTAKNWKFEPSIITVNEGDTVKLFIESVDVTHGFQLIDFDVNENLKPGKIVNIEFVADKKGTFSFFCSVPCGSGHQQMKGTLIVK